MGVLAKTPPMGWNSFDCFGAMVTEAEVKANADYMSECLKQYGWEYVVVDFQWYVPEVDDNGATVGRLEMDAFGRFMPVPARFPSSAGGAGFKPLADHIHASGLKFGIHCMRGIARQAVEENTSIFGSSRRARDIADTKSICGWSKDTYGVDTTKDGSQEYYDSLIGLYAKWGVDFIKYDDCSRPYHKSEIEQIRSAISRCGSEILLSLSPGPTQIEHAEHVKANASMWRVSADFWDNWGDLVKAFDYSHQWSAHAGPGHWPDQDMLPMGHVAIRQERGLRPDRMTRFTRDEQVTMMTLWTISRSPLMFGGHLPDNDEWTASLITNEEVLFVLNHTRGNKQLRRQGDEVVWTALDAAGAVYAALFNTGASPIKVEVSLDELGVKSGRMVRDLWARADLGESGPSVSAQVAPHGARMFKLK